MVKKRVFDIEAVSAWFWDAIEKAGRDPERLAAILEQWSKEMISRFQYEFESTLWLAHDAISSHINSEDEAIAMSGWLVSQGKDYFIEVLKNLRKLPDYHAVDLTQDLSSVAANVYFDRFDESIPIPEGGYWYFVSNPTTDEIGERAFYQRFQEHLFEGLAIHKEYIRRLETTRKSTHN